MGLRADGAGGLLTKGRRTGDSWVLREEVGKQRSEMGVAGIRKECGAGTPALLFVLLFPLL